MASSPGSGRRGPFRLRLGLPLATLLAMILIIRAGSAHALQAASASSPSFDGPIEQPQRAEGAHDSLPASPPYAPDSHAFQQPSDSQPTKVPPLAHSRSSSYMSAFNGTQYRLGRLVVRPAQLKTEACLLVGLIVYIWLSYKGRNTNRALVKSWCEEHRVTLSQKFQQVGLIPGAGPASLFIAAGGPLFYSYATGGKTCKSLMIKFALRPRQDIPLIIYEIIRNLIDFAWTGKGDRLELVFDLSPDPQCSIQDKKSFQPKDSFVWAIVDKSAMNVLREERWDVRTFTEVKESNLLPSQWVIMSESGDVTEQILKNREIALVDTLKSDPSSLQWLEGLVLSGTTPTEPPIAKLPLPSAPTSRTLTLRLRLPSYTLPRSPHASLLNMCFKLIENCPKFTLTASCGKMIKRRSEVSNVILEQHRKQEEKSKEDNRRKKSKALQDEKLLKMSASEQRKFEEKERRRNMVKMSKVALKRK